MWSSHIISSRAWFCPSHQTWSENDCPIVAWFICTLLDPAVWSPLGAQPFGKSQSHSPVFYPSTVPQLSRHFPCLWGQLRDSQRARQCSQHEFLLSLAVNFVVGLNQEGRRFSDSITPLLRWHPSLRQIPGKQVDAVAGLSLRQGASTPQWPQPCSCLCNHCPGSPAGIMGTWALGPSQDCKGGLLSAKSSQLWLEPLCYLKVFFSLCRGFCCSIFTILVSFPWVCLSLPTLCPLRNLQRSDVFYSWLPS